MKNKVFALLISLIMCLSLLPVSAFADECRHEGEDTIVLMPAKVTCGEAYREHYKCTRCGKLFSDPKGEHEISALDVELEILAHTSDLQHVDADLDITCIKGGNAEYWLCPECGQMFSENPGVDGEGKDISRTKPIPDDKIKDYIYPALGHIVNPEIVPAVPHDCRNNGTIAFYCCDRCGAAFADPAGKEQLFDITDYTPGHSKTEFPEVRHTCDKDGNYYYFCCNACGYYYDANGMQIENGSWVDPARHDYVEHPASDPTCMSEGNVFYYSCENCGKVFDADKNETTLDAVTIPMVPHRLTIHVDAVPKTCYTDGNIEYWQCDSCYTCFADAEGTVPVVSVEVPASHDFVATEAKEPTCTEDGNIAYWTCSAEDCGIVVDKNGNRVWSTVIAATGHKPEKVESTATCTEAGVAEHYRCTSCSKLFKDALCTEETTLEELAVEPLGHNYDINGQCTRCGAISPDTPAFEGVSYVDVPTPQGTWQQAAVRVSAPQGVFPAGSRLYAQVVQNVDKQTKEAVDAAREEGTNVARSYTFDIKVLNRDGLEVQLADDRKETISFALAEAENENLDVTVYRVAKEGAATLDADVEGNTITAVTNDFSFYTVEFTYSELWYELPIGESVALTKILDTLCLYGNIDNAISSNPALLDIQNENGIWKVCCYQPFQSDESLIITLDDIDYTIKVTTTMTVVFEMNGIGTAPATQYIRVGEKAVRPATPTVEGYVFDNWYADAACTTLFDFTNTVIVNNTTIYAEWRCEVTFVTAHGTAPTKLMVDINGKAAKPADLSWIGYKWGGWYSDSTYTKAFDFKTAITANTTLYAKWVPDFKITKGDGGTAHYGSSYAFTLNYYYPDYNKNKTEFDVFVARKDGDYSLLSKEHYVVTQADDKRVMVTLKASYIRTLVDGATYSIIFDTGLPDPPADLGVTTGSFKVSKAPTAFFTVSFDNNGVTGAVNMPDDQFVASGGKAASPAAVPSADGYQFLDWYIDQNGTTAFDFNNTVITQNTVVYAKWVTNALRLPAGLSTIEAEAFAGVNAQMIIVPESVDEIESRAFADCPNLEILYFEGSPYSIARDILSGSDNAVVSVVQGSSAKKWAERAGVTYIYH